MADTELPEMTVYYAGKRVLRDGKTLCDAWTTSPDLTPNLFKKAPGTAVGHGHTVRGKTDDEGNVTTMQGSPRWESDLRVPDEVRAAWQAEDVAARGRRNRSLAEARAAADDVIARRAEPVLELIRKGRTAADRRAIAARLRDLAEAAVWQEN